MARPRSVLLFFRLCVSVAFLLCSAETLVAGDAGIMAPEVEETSNWNTSVHIPELNIGPAIVSYKGNRLLNTHHKSPKDNPKRKYGKDFKDHLIYSFQSL